MLLLLLLNNVLAGQGTGTQIAVDGQAASASSFFVQASAATLSNGQSTGISSAAAQFKSNVLASADAQSTNPASAPAALFTVISGQSVAGTLAAGPRALQALAQSQSAATGAGFALPAAYVVAGGVSTTQSFANIGKGLAASAIGQSCSTSFYIADQARVSVVKAVFSGVSSASGTSLSFAASLSTSRAQSAYQVTAFGARWTDYIIAIAHTDEAWSMALSEQAAGAARFDCLVAMAASQPLLHSGQTEAATYGAISEIIYEN